MSNPTPQELVRHWEIERFLRQQHEDREAQQEQKENDNERKQTKPE
jgi:hypothetical protein